MRLAVISDIHGNLEAFKEVISDIDRCQINAVVCLGDTIGYGPEPEEVIALIRQRNVPTVMGNHELVIRDPEQLIWFNSRARLSLQMTARLLSDDSIDYICCLNPYLIDYECRFVHGFPPDSPTLYLFQVAEKEMVRIFKQMKEQLCFIGHTHTLEIIEFDGRTLRHARLKKNLARLEDNRQYIINIGSVGQPRDGNNNAKYVIWDASANCVEVRYIPYDIPKVVQQIKAAGLPQEHAARLL